jgi:hypothetical protein
MITEKWLATSWSRRIEKREKVNIWYILGFLFSITLNLTLLQRANLTDLERFKVAKAKQARNKMIRTAFFAIRNKNTTTAKKARVRIEKLRAKSKAYGKAQKAEKKAKAKKA